MTEVEILRLARVIHIARIEEGSFKGHPGYSGYDAMLRRMPWPQDRKDATRLIQAGQSWMDLAIAQARAVARHLASVGAHPEGGDALAAPFMGDAVPKADAQTPPEGASS